MSGPIQSADVFTPATAEELSRFVAQNALGEKRPLVPIGGRTALHLGYPRPEGDRQLAMNGLNRIVDYPARDMTITVEAGLRIDDLQKQLEEEGQRLPIDVPLAHRATIGGAIATNASGPGRFRHGTFRDYVIGISAVDGQGRLFSAGGRVVKNVAGYDLCKLLVGSLGTLAIISQVTLKLRPLAATRQLVWGAFAEPQTIDKTLERLLTSETRPVAIELLNPRAARQIQRESKLDLPIDRWILCVGYEGGANETDWQVDRLQDEWEPLVEASRIVETDDSDPLWSALTEYQAASDDPLTFRASLPPARVVELVRRASAVEIAVQSHAGSGVVIGHLPDRCLTADDARELLSPLQEFATACSGSVVITSCDDDWKSQVMLFGPQRSASPLEQRVKRALDPHNVLSPGRFGPLNKRV